MILLSADLRRVLVATAIALLGIFVVTMLALALPLRLLQPDWIVRMCSALLGGISFPLVAMVLLLLAAEGRPIDQERPAIAQEQPAITRLRRLCWVVALGFVLMIPLQTWAGVKLLRQTLQSDQQQLVPLRRALELIRIAETSDAMIAAIAAVPGAPPNLSGELRDPLPKVRQQLIDELQPQLRARQTQLQALNTQRWQQSLVRWFKDACVAAFSALGFAAIGRMSPARPTLLSSALAGQGPQWRRVLAGRRSKAWKRLWPWSGSSDASKRRKRRVRLYY